MGRPRLCNCKCESPPPPDCFGCTGDIWFPSVWAVDMPSTMTVPSTVTCGPTGSTVAGGGYSGLDIRDTFSASAEWPKIPPYSFLIVDDRPIANYAFSWLTCVWLSNDYRMANRRTWGTIPWNNASCSHGGHYPGAVKEADWFAPNPWYYYELPTVSISPNRSRVNAATDHPHDVICGTEVDPALPDASSPRYVCGFNWPFGSQWYLLIEHTGSTFKFVATLRYWMRLSMSYFVEENLPGGPFYPATGWRPAVGGPPSFVDFMYAPGQVNYFHGFWPSGFGFGSGYCKSTLFPSYGSDINFHISPDIVRYEKVINCATDFDGTPVVLTKAYDIKAHPTSTKTIIEAMGISASPSYITLTPVV